MKKLLALFCACLLLGGCGMRKVEIPETILRVDEIRGEEDSIRYIAGDDASYLNFYLDTDAILAEYDRETGENSLIAVLPDGREHLWHGGRIWCTDENRLISCSDGDGGDVRTDNEWKNAGSIWLEAAGGDELLIRCTEKTEDGKLSGGKKLYILWNMETGEETLLENSDDYWNIKYWDGDLLVYSIGQHLYCRNGEETMLLAVHDDVPKYTSKDIPAAAIGETVYWIIHDSYDKETLYWQDPGQDEPSSVRTPMGGETTSLRAHEGRLYFQQSKPYELYSYDPETGQFGGLIFNSLPTEIRGGVHLAGGSYFYAEVKDDRLVFTEKPLEPIFYLK